MESNQTIGILLQGKISPWTSDIIIEYQYNFPDAEILVSTWDDQNTEDLDCNIIKSPVPPLPEPHKSTVNFQIVGCKAGLKKLKTDLIMKCRTDQFIHNDKIFQIFHNSFSRNKIMVPDLGTPENVDYRTSDFCQVGFRQTLLDFWEHIPLYDGINYEEAATYLTKNYVLNVKNDFQPWEFALKKYFLIKSFHDDFQIEWEKLNNFDAYRNIYDVGFKNRRTINF
ncbi:MAG: hypothetical protein CXT78_00315 [Thaumarchaeota archaeon]|nr:MAG: hypothetical protein CXT78_00315 [Nitrososphaerota archaeon]